MQLLTRNHVGSSAQTQQPPLHRPATAADSAQTPLNWSPAKVSTKRRAIRVTPSSSQSLLHASTVQGRLCWAAFHWDPPRSYSEAAFRNYLPPSGFLHKRNAPALLSRYSFASSSVKTIRAFPSQPTHHCLGSRKFYTIANPLTWMGLVRCERKSSALQNRRQVHDHSGSAYRALMAKPDPRNGSFRVRDRSYRFRRA